MEQCTMGDSLGVDDLVYSAVNGDRRALARCISAIEVGGPVGFRIDDLARSSDFSAYVTGITGAPGAGKSTLVDQLISDLRRMGRSVAVLAVDPTSPFSGGALLGDRVRMQRHAMDGGVFVRSLATRGHLGGLARPARLAVRLLVAAGFDEVIIETVGVGQVEIEVTDVADTTVVVVNPGWGDSVQVNKAGLMEMAEVFVLNKADRGDVDASRRDLEHMLDLSGDSKWRPPVVQTVATGGEGIDELIDAIQRHRAYLQEGDRLLTKRRDRVASEIREMVMSQVSVTVSDACSTSVFDDLAERVRRGEVSVAVAADEVLATISGPWPRANG